MSSPPCSGFFLSSCPWAAVDMNISTEINKSYGRRRRGDVIAFHRQPRGNRVTREWGSTRKGNELENIKNALIIQVMYIISLRVYLRLAIDNDNLILHTRSIVLFALRKMNGFNSPSSEWKSFLSKYTTNERCCAELFALNSRLPPPPTVLKNKKRGGRRRTDLRKSFSFFLHSNWHVSTSSSYSFSLSFSIFDNSPLSFFRTKKGGGNVDGWRRAVASGGCYRLRSVSFTLLLLPLIHTHTLFFFFVSFFFFDFCSRIFIYIQGRHTHRLLLLRR